MFINIWQFGAFFSLPTEQSVVGTILSPSAARCLPFSRNPSLSRSASRTFRCQCRTLARPAMERIRLSKRKSCFASFISAPLISRASDGSLTGLMIGDDKLRTPSRSPIRSAAELDVINLILHFLHLPPPPQPPSPHPTKTPSHISMVCGVATHTHTRRDTHKDRRTLVGPLGCKIWQRGRRRSALVTHLITENVEDAHQYLLIVNRSKVATKSLFALY